VAAYLTSRVLLAVCAAVLAAQHHQSLVSILTPWDGGYYVAIATSGYPSAVHLVPAPAFNSTTSAFFAFFPLFPLLGRGLAIVTRMPIGWALVSVTWLAGAASSLLAAALVATRYGARRGLQAGVLLAVFPGSVVDGIVYADGVAVAFALGALLAAERRRYLLAGALGLAATASLSLFLVPLVVALLLSAAAARSWRGLVAPVLAACGAGAYLLYLWVDTGSPFTWTRVERAGWMVHLSAPWSSGTAFYDYAFWKPGVTALTIASVAVAAVGLVLLVVVRAPLAWTVLGVLAVIGVTFDGGAWIAPRFVFDAFPLVLACGIALPRRALWPVAALSAVALALLLAAYSPANSVFLNV
ncbi:MAG TPA: hypothetical protein VMD59_02970, partial [Acidimicrobiales bacterium]|nr:hypothetical protein [Acidimicrobiales bacterium]